MASIHRHNSIRCFSARQTMGLEEYLMLLWRALEKSTLISGRQKEMFLQVYYQLIAQAHEVGTIDWRSLRLYGDDLHASNILWRNGSTFVDLEMPVMARLSKISGCCLTARVALQVVSTVAAVERLC